MDLSKISDVLDISLVGNWSPNALIMMERSDLYSVKPSYWMTFSIDPRIELDLTPLWYELKRREIEVWGKDVPCGSQIGSP